MAASLAPSRQRSCITNPRNPIPQKRMGKYLNEFGSELLSLRQKNKLNIQMLSHLAQVNEELIKLIEAGRSTGRFGAVESVSQLAGFFGCRLTFFDMREEYECEDCLLRLDQLVESGVRPFLTKN